MLSLFNVFDGTKLELFVKKFIHEINNENNIIIFEKIKGFKTA